MDELFGAHELLTIPFMTGVNNDEGGWLLSEVSLNAIEICESKHDFVLLWHTSEMLCVFPF